MYQIGHLYNKNGVTGIVIYVDDSGHHGLLMSLEEKHCNWQEAIEWCKSLGLGWFLPTYKDFKLIADDLILSKTQNGLIENGIPLCFGDSSPEGTNCLGHGYWTKDVSRTSIGYDFIWCFYLCNSGFSSFGYDYKESEFVYTRAFHSF